jgi:phytoene desaturase (3,4-didehydrolycopene-forming)
MFHRPLSSVAILCVVVLVTKLTMGWQIPSVVTPKAPSLESLASSLSSKTDPNHKTILIVGAGVGGLAMASRIRHYAQQHQHHWEVHILERNARVGGRCGSFLEEVNNTTNKSGGDGNIPSVFRHEHGPSLLLLPHIYEELFIDCGTTAQACGLHIQECIPAYQCVFDDGDCIHIGYPDHRVPTTGKSTADVFTTTQRKTHTSPSYAKEIQASRQKMDSWEPGGAARWDEYMRVCQAFLDCGLPNFIEERLDLASFPAFLQESLRGFGKTWPLKPHSDVLDALFQSEKLKAVASFQDLYVGLEPFRNDKELFGGIVGSTAPAVFGLLSAIELHPTNTKCGVYAPIGGFQAVTDAMENLALKLGVYIHVNATVTKITNDAVHYCDTHDPSSSVDVASADLIVVNADLPYTTSCLVHNKDSPDDMLRYDWDDGRGSRDLLFSSGVVAFHWSINKTLNDLDTHNVFLSTNSSADAKQSWSVLRHSGADFVSDGPFNFYVHRASSTDPTAAPKVSCPASSARMMS